MEDPSGLWVRILKGLYFPNESFLEAKKGGRASWGWSSIIQGRDVLKRDGLWRVGTGENIRIYSDPWIAQKSGYRSSARIEPATSSRDVPAEPRVAEFITDEGTWNIQRVRKMIDEDDAELILSMPVYHNRTEDKFIWPHSRSGEPSARSVYHRLRDTNTSSADQGSSSSTRKELWRAIWGTGVVPKVKNFA